MTNSVLTRLAGTTRLVCQHNLSLLSTSQMPVIMQVIRHAHRQCWRPSPPISSGPAVVAGNNSNKLHLTPHTALFYKGWRWSFSSGPTGPEPAPKRAEVQDRVMAALKKFDKIDASKLSYDTNLVKDLGLDSLDHVELIMAIEDEFAVEINEADGEKLVYPKDLVAHVMKLLHGEEPEML